jgi:DNA polymerase-3 subunit epsilon
MTTIDDLPGAWWRRPLWVLDFETTGPDPMEALPVEVGLYLVDVAGAVLRAVEGLVDPGCPIPVEASAVHGIYDHDIAQGDCMSRQSCCLRIAQEIQVRRQLDDGEQTPLVIFNATYDWCLLVREAERHGVVIPRGQPIVDPLLLDRVLDKWRSGQRTLAAVCERWGVALGHAHAARDDCLAAVAVARAIAQAWGPQPNRKFGGTDRNTRYFRREDMLFPGLQRRQTQLYAAWRDDVNDYWRKNDTRDDGVLRQETGSWPLGRLPRQADPADPLDSRAVGDLDIMRRIDAPPATTPPTQPEQGVLPL